MAQQSETTIQLLDKDSHQPIGFAHYLIGEQKGVSDKEGYIHFNLANYKELQLSHILYGHVVIADTTLKNALSEGSILLSTAEIMLQPAIIMGVHSNKNTKQVMEVNYQDLLTHDAGAYLEQNPAISSIKKSGSYGFDPIFRGFKYDQLNIVIDGGQSTMAACPNRMDPPASQISLNMINRVEILKGPHSLRYGNSFGGTFHFISPDPTYTEKVKTFGRVSGSYESNGSVGRTEAMIGVRQKWFNLKVLGSHSTGFDYTDGDGKKVPAEFTRSSIGTTIDFRLTEKQNLSLSVTNNIAADVDFPTLPMDLRKDNTLLLNAKHTVIFNNKVFNSLKSMAFGSFVDHVMDNLTKSIDPRMFNATTYAQTKSYGGRTEARFNFTSAWAFAGVDLRINEQEGTRDRSFLTGPMANKTVTDNVWQDGFMQQMGAFGEFHANASGYYFVVALRLDINNSEIKAPAPEFSEINPITKQNYLNLSASIGATHNLTSNNSLGLWIGRAQRSGSLTELYINFFPVGLDAYEMVGNPALKPEVNNQVDFNYKWQPKTAIIDINIFASYLTDYISSEIKEEYTTRMPNSPGVRQYMNIDKALMTGFEISWKQQLIWKIDHRISATYTYAENLETNNALPEIPPMEFQYKLNGSYFNNKLKPEISLRHVLSQNRIDESFGETTSPSFTLIDVKASYAVGNVLVLSAGILNVFNQAYYEHLSRATTIENKRPLYSPGRNGFATVTLKF
jgi:iron complex outermembrane receptor protein